MSGAGTHGVSSEAGREPTGPVSGLRAWLEALLVTGLAGFIGWRVDARDPFFLQGFPWVIVAPLLIGLQNGFRYALVSGVALCVGAYATWRAGWVGLASFPVGYAVSVGLLGAVAGEYRDVWRRSLEALRRRSQDSGQRLDELTRAYHLLKRSHDVLEQRLAANGPSLQATLERMETHIARGERTLEAAGESVLQLLGAHAQVQIASLHEVSGHGPGSRRLVVEPVAALGTPPPFDAEHPLIQDALATGQLTCVREERIVTRGSAPLACVPLCDVRGRIHGVALVHAMPFVAMHDEHLMLLATLAGRVGDWLAGAAQDAHHGVEASEAPEAPEVPAPPGPVPDYIPPSAAEPAGPVPGVVPPASMHGAAGGE